MIFTSQEKSNEIELNDLFGILEIKSSSFPLSPHYPITPLSYIVLTPKISQWSFIFLDVIIWGGGIKQYTPYSP